MGTLGNTVQIRAVITDFNGELLEPDTHEVKIYDPSNALILTLTSATKESAGVYYIKYTTPADGPAGIWRIVWKVVKGNDIGTGRMSLPMLSAS